MYFKIDEDETSLLKIRFLFFIFFLISESKVTFPIYIYRDFDYS